MRGIPIVVIALVLAAMTASGQSPQQASQAKPAAPQKTATPPPAAQQSSVPTPPDYVIGPDDQLSIVFWIEPKMSAESVVVRSDGKISLPLINDVQAAGLTPDQLRERLMQAASKYIEDTTVTVIVRQINSRKVYITGEVTKGGAFPLTGSLTVMQVIALAGGVLEYAKVNEITVLREEEGRTRAHRFSYEDVSRGQKLEQNFELRPGDTIVVP